MSVRWYHFIGIVLGLVLVSCAWAVDASLNTTAVEIANGSSHFSGYPTVVVTPMQVEMCCGKKCHAVDSDYVHTPLYNKISVSMPDEQDIYVTDGCRLNINSVKVSVQKSAHDQFSFVQHFNQGGGSACYADTVSDNGVYRHHNLYLSYYISGHIDPNKHRRLCCSNHVDLGVC